MPERLTPEHIADCMDKGTWMLETLADHGYVIVHPDDVLEEPKGDIDDWCAGWNACRALVFGESDA